MTTETDVQAFIEAQRRLLKLEMERMKNDQLAGCCKGIDLDVEEGRCNRKGASVLLDGGLPQTIVTDNGYHLAARYDSVRENDQQNDVLQSNNQNDPLVEPLPLSCDGRCLDKEKQASLAETLVQSENPLTFTRSNVRHTPPSSLQSSPTRRSSTSPQGNSPPGLGSNDSGTARMFRRGAGEYSPTNRRVNTQTHLGGFGLGLANIVKQQQQKQKQDTPPKDKLGGLGLSDIVQQHKQKQDLTAQQTHKDKSHSNNYVGLGLSNIVTAQQQKQRQDLNLNLNNVNKPKHNRHVHYNSNVIGGNGVDTTIYEYGTSSGSSSVYKSNLNKFQEDNLYLHDTAIINNNQPIRRGIITNNKHHNQRNINLNINNNITEDQQQSSALFIHNEEASELDLTDADTATNTNDSDDTSDNYCKGNENCACAPTDCVMHHNSRSPILHRLDRSSGVGTSSGTTGIGVSGRLSHMDKPRSILSNRYYTSATSPRERLLSDLKHTYVPTSVIDGFSFSDRTEEYERERVKKELYQNELRLQIEEKRRQATMRENQERVEQELENRRLEQQLLRMHEEELRDEERRTLRRNSEDLHRRAQEIGTRASYQRRHTDSESNLHKMPSPYSPPMTRRNQMHNMSGAATGSVFDTSPVTSRYNAQALRNRMDSLSDSYGTYNTYGGGRSTIDGASVFNRYDSLSRIDALKQQHTTLNRLDNLTLNDSYSNRIQRRHSATHQDLSASRRSPKLQRRSSSSSRFDTDSLPIPLLKAASHSPVARELRMATAINSNKYSVSDSLRRLEEKWQIPAVQKNIMSYDVYPDGHNRSILTQLGSMRMQLQQEQLRMDEALRRRGYSSQYKAVNFH